MGKKSKKKKRGEEVVEDPQPLEPQLHFYRNMQFSSQREVGIARFICEKGIEVKPKEIEKLVALICEHGILADNEQEIRFANLLRKNNIRFEYSKRIETKRIISDKDHPESPDTTANKKNVKVEPNSREIDFWLPDGPILVPLCQWEIQAFEIKGGKLSIDNWKQQREIRDAGYRTFIAIPEYITFWEKYGLLEPVTMINKKARGKYQKPLCLIENDIPENESETKEALMKVLVENNINFEYVEDDRNCPPNRDCHRSIFFLRKPTKGFWCGDRTQAIMLIEGEINLEDLERWEEVSESFCTFIANWNFVCFWQRYGFLRQRT